MSVFKPGRIFPIAAGGSVTVVEKLAGLKVKVKHNDKFGHELVTLTSSLYEGNIKNPYAPNVSGHGYFGVGPYVGVKGKKRYNSYSLWRTMLARAYVKPGNRKVCDEWLDFQVFTRWYLKELTLIEEGSFKIADYLEEDGVYRPPVIVEDYLQAFYLQLAEQAKNNPEIENTTRIDGLRFGYPVCCIESFIKDLNEARTGRRHDRALTGTGYIPCVTCDVRYTEQQLVDNINAKRNPKYPPFAALIDDI